MTSLQIVLLMVASAAAGAWVTNFWWTRRVEQLQIHLEELKAVLEEEGIL